MGGEGKFKEIVMASAYALIPMVLIYPPMTLASRFMVQEEAVFYICLRRLRRFGLSGLVMTVHQYSAGKTVVTMFLTLIVMGIIVFLGTLVLSMMQRDLHVRCQRLPRDPIQAIEEAVGRENGCTRCLHVPL